MPAKQGLAGPPGNTFAQELRQILITWVQLRRLGPPPPLTSGRPQKNCGKG